MPYPADQDRGLADSIRELNLSYLMIAQHLLRENMASGMYRLGLDEQTAQILLALSPAQTVQIASAGNLLCDFRLNNPHHLRALRLDKAAVLTPGAPQSLYHAHHVTILLAQQECKEQTART